MTETRFSSEEKELILQWAEEHGDTSACAIFSLNAATLRSWRHRAERKVVDHRQRDENISDGGSAGPELLDVAIPDGGWDGARGCESKASARARLVEGCQLGPDLVTQAPNRDLAVPAAVAASFNPAT